MDNSSKSFKELLDTAKNVLVLLPAFVTADSCAAVGLITKVLRERFNKDVEVGASSEIPSRFHSILQNCAILPERVITQIEPISYVIHVNDSKEGVDIDWESQGNGLDIVLTPETQEIDFSKISFAKKGGIYDLVITVNVSTLDQLGPIYTEREKQFAKYTVVAINSGTKSVPGVQVTLNDSYSSTASEVVRKLFNLLNIEFDRAETETFLSGILTSTYGLHNASKITTYQNVIRAGQKYSIDLKEIINRNLYSLTNSEIELWERMWRNVRVDEGRNVIYSIITQNDFAQTATTPASLQGINFIPFNVNKDIDIAFIVFDTGQECEVLLQANTQAKNFDWIVQSLHGVRNGDLGIARLDGNALQNYPSILENISNPLKVLENGNVSQLKLSDFSQTNTKNSVNEVKETIHEAEPKLSSNLPEPQIIMPSEMHKKPSTSSSSDMFGFDTETLNVASDNQSEEVSKEQLSKEAQDQEELFQDKTLSSSPANEGEQNVPQSSLSSAEQDKLKPSSPQDSGALNSPQNTSSVEQNALPIERQNPELIEDNATPIEPTPQSPFTKASDFISDPNAAPMKRGQSFTYSNPPFDKGTV